MKPISLALAAILATLAVCQTASAEPARKRVSPFMSYVDPYTGENMTVYRPNYLVPSNDFEGGDYPGSYAVRRALGQCVIDLGYGRTGRC